MTDHLDDRLSGLLDAELSPDDEAAVRAHLAACEACRSELEAVRTARSWVRALPAVDPPFGFYERLLLQEPRPGPERARRRLPYGLTAMAAAAAAALVVVGLGSPQEAPVAPRVEQLVHAHASSGATDDPVGHLLPGAVPVSFGQ